MKSRSIIFRLVLLGCAIAIVAGASALTGEKAAPKLRNNIFYSSVETAVPFTNSTPVFLFAGIGNPQGFRRTLASLGAGIKKLVALPDHDMRMADVLRGLKDESPGMRIVVTEKDAAKLSTLPDSSNVWVLSVAFSIRRNEVRSKANTVAQDPIVIEEDRTIRHSLVLKEVEYVVEARLHPHPCVRGKSDLGKA